MERRVERNLKSDAQVQIILKTSRLEVFIHADALILFKMASASPRSFEIKRLNQTRRFAGRNKLRLLVQVRSLLCLGHNVSVQSWLFLSSSTQRLCCRTDGSVSEVRVHSQTKAKSFSSKQEVKVRVNSSYLLHKTTV